MSTLVTGEHNVVRTTNDSKRKQFPPTRWLFHCDPNVFLCLCVGCSSAAIAVVTVLGPIQLSLEMSTIEIAIRIVGLATMKKRTTMTRKTTETKKERDLPANKKRQNFALFFRISSRLAEVRSTLLFQRPIEWKRSRARARVSKLKWRDSVAYERRDKICCSPGIVAASTGPGVHMPLLLLTCVCIVFGCDAVVCVP